MKKYDVRIFLLVILTITPLVFGLSLDNSFLIKSTEFGFQNIRLSTQKNIYPHTVEPTIALDGSTLYVGYKNANLHNGGGWAVSYTYSTDGLVWSDPIYMEQFWSTGSGQSDPWMLVYNHTLYYMYLEFPTGDEGQSQITLAKTNDLGSTWNFTRASYGTGFADKQTFAIDNNGTIFMVYDDVHYDISGDVESIDMRLSRSYDAGISFIDNITIQDEPGPNYIGQYIALGGSDVLYNVFGYGGLYINQSDIFFDKSLDGGNTWGKDTDLNPSFNASAYLTSGGGYPDKSTLPSMKVDQNGRIYITWADVSADIANLNWDVYMRYSDDMGETWSERKKINQYMEKNSWMPDLDLDSEGNVYFAYYDNNDNETTRSNLKYRIYFPGNDTLSNEITISNIGSRSNYGRLGDYLTIRMDDEDHFHVVWTDGRDDLLEIYYATDKYGLVEITSTASATSNPSSSSSSFSGTRFSTTSFMKPSSSMNSSKSPVLQFGYGLVILIIWIQRKRF